MKINLIKNTFYNEKETKEKLCRFIMKAKKLSMGRECARAEMNFAKYVNRKYCDLLNSGSSANLALVQAYLNLGKLTSSAPPGPGPINNMISSLLLARALSTIPKTPSP